MAGTASADTLREALVAAYQTNPTLSAQRENLKATDANVAIARAAGRPEIVGSLGLNRNLTRSGVILDSQGNDHNISLSGEAQVRYPFFSGGAVKNSVRAAKSRVEAGRATLSAVEGDVFTQAVSAYMDEGFSKAVTYVFVELYKRGLAYRDKRLVNWDPKFQTAISDLEVETRDVQGRFWTLSYPLADNSGAIQVATTRPETMLADMCLEIVDRARQRPVAAADDHHRGPVDGASHLGLEPRRLIHRDRLDQLDTCIGQEFLGLIE